MKDLFTIALPVYKRTEYIREALDSAVNQTIPCRILLVDNNSPHGEFKNIVEGYNNPLIKYVKTTETVPQDENFNNCIRLCETPWLTILHDDDILHIQYVEMVQKILNSYGTDIAGFAVVCSVGSEVWNGLNVKVSLSNDIKLVKESYFYFHQLSPFAGVTINRQKALRLGGFDSTLHPIADFDFWCRLSTSARMLFVNQKLAYYRISPTQSTNHLINAMINNVYEYRMRLIEQGTHNNFLTKLGLETTRIYNIDFFKNTYQNVEIPTSYTNMEKYERTRKLIRNKWINKLIWKYIRHLMYKKVNPVF